MAPGLCIFLHVNRLITPLGPVSHKIFDPYYFQHGSIGIEHFDNIWNYYSLTSWFALIYVQFSINIENHRMRPTSSPTSKHRILLHHILVYSSPPFTQCQPMRCLILPKLTKGKRACWLFTSLRSVLAAWPRCSRSNSPSSPRELNWGIHQAHPSAL